MATPKHKPVKPKTKGKTTSRAANTNVRSLPNGVSGTRYSQFDSGDDDAYGIRAIDFRMFIHGVEVTEHVVGSLTISRAGRDGEGTMSFTLDNNYDKFVLRTANFAGKDPRNPNAYNSGKDWQEQSFTRDTWDTGGLKIVNSDSSNPGEAKNFIDPNRGDSSNDGLFLFSEHAKQRLYHRKYLLNASARETYLKLLSTAENAGTDFRPHMDNYRLIVGEPIVSHMDHVRCFIMDPLMDPAEVYSGDLAQVRWMPAFTGFVDVVTKSTDLMTGKATLEISCMDIRTVLKRKRMLVNATAVDGDNMLADPSAGIAGLYANLTTANLGSSDTTNDMQLMNFKQVLAAIFCNHSKASPTPIQSYLEAHQPQANTSVLADFKTDIGRFGASETTGSSAKGLTAAQKYEMDKAANLKADTANKIDNLKSIAAIQAAEEKARQDAALASRAAAVNAGVAGIDSTGGDSSANMKTLLTPGHWRQIPKVVGLIRGETGAKDIAGKFGVGRYAVGHYMEFPDIRNMSESDKKATIAHFMSDWEALTVFGTNRTWYQDSDVDTIGAQTYPGGEFSAFIGFVHYMEPSRGIGIRQFMDSTILNQMAPDREYKSVYEIINSICARIDYQFQVNGMGDIMIEPPFYDLLPTDLGDWKYVHAVGNSVKSSSVNDDTNSNPITCLKVTGGAVNMDDPTVTDEKLLNNAYTLFVKSDYLTEKYGFIEEDREIHCITKVSAEVGSTVPNIDVQKLAVMGILEFTKNLAAMSSLQADAAFNPFLYPNRPYLAFYERRVGTTGSCTVTLDIGASASSGTELTMVRAFTDAGVCSTITGFANTPFSLSNPDEALKSLLDMDGSVLGNGIRTRAGVEVFITEDNKLKSANAGTFTGGQVNALPKTPAVVAAMQKLLSNHPGLQASDLIGVMSCESGGNRFAKNTDKPENSAAGIFQLVMSSYKTTRDYANKHHLQWPTPAVAVDLSSPEAYQTSYCAAYDEAAQFQIWDIYLKSAEAAGGRKITNATDIAIANNGVKFLRDPNAVIVIPGKKGKPDTVLRLDTDYVTKVHNAANTDYAKSWLSSAQTATSQATQEKAKPAIELAQGPASVVAREGSSMKIGASGANDAAYQLLAGGNAAITGIVNKPTKPFEIPDKMHRGSYGN